MTPKNLQTVTDVIRLTVFDEVHVNILQVGFELASPHSLYSPTFVLIHFVILFSILSSLLFSVLLFFISVIFSSSSHLYSFPSVSHFFQHLLSPFIPYFTLVQFLFSLPFPCLPQSLLSPYFSSLSCPLPQSLLSPYLSSPFYPFIFPGLSVP